MKLEDYKAAIELEIKSLKLGEPKQLYDPIRYIMDLGGKRLRPLLCLLSYNLFLPDWQKIIRPAIALEVFHNFTLMHDDIMDNAPLRRGNQTIHEKWNANIGILSGDVMMVKAYDLIATVNEKYLATVLSAFNQCATHVCEGQQIDMNFEDLSTVSETEYLDMIEKKTAALLGFSMKLGGILSNQKEETLSNLYSYASNLGMAFQLRDDLLDVYGDTRFGKQPGGDIISNKKTILLIEALEKSSGETHEKLQRWISKRDFDPNEKVREVKTIYDDLGIRELVERKIEEFSNLASGYLSSIQGEKEAISSLQSFTENLKQRVK